METLQLLTGHVLYELDLVILKHLGTVLENALGEPFRDYCAEEAALVEEMKGETKRIGSKLAQSTSSDDIELQEQVLPGFRTSPEARHAWAVLMETAERDWQDICLLYRDVLVERYDLECMAVALQTAREKGSADHAAQIEEVLGLDKATIPTWWR